MDSRFDPMNSLQEKVKKDKDQQTRAGNKRHKHVDERLDGLEAAIRELRILIDKKKDKE